MELGVRTGTSGVHPSPKDFYFLGVAQLKALRWDGMATPLSPPSPRPFGPWGGGRKIFAPMGNELRKSCFY